MAQKTGTVSGSAQEEVTVLLQMKKEMIFSSTFQKFRQRDSEN